MYSTQNFRLYLTVIVTKLDFNTCNHGQLRYVIPVIFLLPIQGGWSRAQHGSFNPWTWEVTSGKQQRVSGFTWFHTTTRFSAYSTPLLPLTIVIAFHYGLASSVRAGPITCWTAKPATTQVIKWGDTYIVVVYTLLELGLYSWYKLSKWIAGW